MYPTTPRSMCTDVELRQSPDTSSVPTHAPRPWHTAGVRFGASLLETPNDKFQLRLKHVETDNILGVASECHGDVSLGIYNSTLFTLCLPEDESRLPEGIACIGWVSKTTNRSRSELAGLGKNQNWDFIWRGNLQVC